MEKRKESKKGHKTASARPRSAQPRVSTKKTRWLDPVNLSIGIASLVLGVVVLILGLRAGPTVSLGSPLDLSDVLTTPIEIANNGLLDLKDVRVVTFVILIAYGPEPGPVFPAEVPAVCPQFAHSCVQDLLVGGYVPPNKILKVGESETVSLRSVEISDQHMIHADIALIAFYRPAFMLFWHKRKAFRFVTAIQADGKLVFQKQPEGDALERLNKLTADFPQNWRRQWDVD